MGTTAAKLQAALNSKNAIKDSLENKGLSPSNKFSEYAGLIDELENTSDATATAYTIFEGEVAYTAEGRTVGTAQPGIPVVNTAGTGAAYTATVPNMTALTVGKKITIIPHTISTTANATLNVNGLGAKYIRQRLSTNSGATAAGPVAGWIFQGKPITVMYNGTYWVAELTRPDANYLYGTVPVANGGTGATTAAAARTNLGALGNADVVDNLESTATNLPLSANQGRVLNEKVSELNSKIGNVFSTDEVKTNDIWIDGKPIYRKVLNVSSLPNSTMLSIYHEVSNMKEVVRLYGMAYYSGDSGGVTIPYTDCSNVNNSIEIRANLTSILIVTKSNKSSMRGTIVIEYTKL